MYQIPSCLLPPSEYPERWPLVPFSTPTCRLQERIPLEKLPKKLIVHDPWGCLSGKSREPESKEKWRTKPDVVYTYNLTRIGRKKGKVDVDESSLTDDATEAHLFITPTRSIGVGHHSFIYQAELELPRELVVKPKECVTCSCEGTLITKQEHDNGHIEIYEAVAHHPPYCEHLADGIPRPKTAKVSVTAKLTMPKVYYEEDHPGHLRNEAWNYMNFPEHFFEHWNGYNIIQPCHDPLPVGAVFYGYYVPDKSCGEGFLSPILLLEHCGNQANMKSLTLEERYALSSSSRYRLLILVIHDRRECWSLLERLHLGGYEHNSVYERNILMQSGPVQWKSLSRGAKYIRVSAL